MFPELSIERVFRREIDSLPLPPESSWVPQALSTRRSIRLTAVVICATAVLVLGAVLTAREAGDAAATGRRVVTTPLVNLPRPACLRGVCNVYRNDAFGYGIVLPADWRVAPPLRAATPPSSELDRVEFTAQSSAEWTHLVGLEVVAPWDLVVEVHDRRRMRAEPVRGGGDQAESGSGVHGVVGHLTIAANARVLPRARRSNAHPPLRDRPRYRRPTRGDRAHAARNGRIANARLGMGLCSAPRDGLACATCACPFCPFSSRPFSRRALCASAAKGEFPE